MSSLIDGMTPVMNQLIFDYTLPAGVLVTYQRLAALAWRRQQGQLELDDFNTELLPLLGLSRTQARQHLRLLRMAKLLHWQVAANGRMTIGFPGLYAIAPEIESGNADSDDVVYTSMDKIECIQHQQTQAGKTPERSGTPERVGLEESLVLEEEVGGSQAIQGPSAPVTAASGQVKGRLAGVTEEPGGLPVADGVISGLPGQANGRSDRVSGLTDPVAAGRLAPPGERHSAHSQQRVDPRFGELETLMEDPLFSDVMGWLSRLGIWTDHAIRLARQIRSNELREKGYLPTRADVLGWIAYCYAFKSDNNIRKPAQVVAANLSNNRRCPEALRPPRICLRCNREEGCCLCHSDPLYGYPTKFFEFAMKADYDQVVQTFWAVCLACHAYPCQCEGQV